ncbi:hypothetical protein KL918_004697 [Ogataea parapolymorpha]|nr:hypothetical protein KL918_004697 [Ogataea parapolymorpha]KAG7873900.1 hypothetical protein KL916_002060 [Ogataea parapolymorpha]
MLKFPGYFGKLRALPPETPAYSFSPVETIIDTIVSSAQFSPKSPPGKLIKRWKKWGCCGTAATGCVASGSKKRARNERLSVVRKSPHNANSLSQPLPKKPVNQKRFRVPKQTISRLRDMFSQPRRLLP